MVVVMTCVISSKNAAAAPNDEQKGSRGSRADPTPNGRHAEGAPRDAANRRERGSDSRRTLDVTDHGCDGGGAKREIRPPNFFLADDAMGGYDASSLD